jgi:predicted N-acetyltransferase YhbS
MNDLTNRRPSFALECFLARDAPAPGANRWKIRQATQADLDRLVELSIRLALRTEKRALDEPTVRAGIQSLIDSPSRGFVLVAEDEKGAVVGEVMVGGFEWSEWSNGLYWCVTSCAVSPAYNRQERKAVARALHQSLVERAMAEGAIGLKASVLQGYVWLACFFPDLGFRPNKCSVLEQRFGNPAEPLHGL